ncbi:MAG TPA: 16S rRNA (guanine(527)-N(7))-methyltransferase RsmG [Thermoanaerobaculia bacterium]|nr:16S rRNA (guanine(527)-N(7))-methyltransferase RsmG [Thermoanaerobaculia bacterium]HUM29169.1 16S rRNA (guanine(527)-N(7))-methyltransferase RsmG [Thermoanaerobaculia bacterium]HXK67547.1 16S rRNA (guanine(527)-N(7))-methyltransferase RsmG [Thermoanaerobaculia bacterium]
MSTSDRIKSFARSVGYEPTPFQWESLERYANLVVEWNRAINLVRFRNQEELWIRHILEPLILLPSLHARTFVDIGAGAGFMSIPVAICRPDIDVIGLESAPKRAAFLARVVRELQLPYRLVRDRFERWIPSKTLEDTLVVARAFPSWEKVLPPLLRRSEPGASIALFVGEDWETRVASFLPFWTVSLVMPMPEKTSSFVVFLGNVSRET